MDQEALGMTTYDYSQTPPVLVTAPATLPVATADAKEWVPSFADQSDAVVEAYLGAATAAMDGPYGMLGRCIVTQTWAQGFDQDATRYRLPPLGNVAVTEVLQGSTTVDSADYTTGEDALGVYVDGPSGVTEIQFTAGFGDASAVPENIAIAIALMAADQYARVSTGGNLRSFTVDGAFSEKYNSPDQNSQSTMRTVDALISRYRNYVFA